MSEIEKQIIDMIESNPHLSEELQKRYILALFLMTTKEQEEYLRLIQAFTYRCNSAEKGIYVLRADEAQKVMRTLEDVKQDIINKIQSNP